jgi:hypothetical protein
MAIEYTDEPGVADGSPTERSSAGRMRRHRSRKRREAQFLAFELDRIFIDAMIKKGVLPLQARRDPDAIVESIFRLLQLALF